MSITTTPISPQKELKAARIIIQQQQECIESLKAELAGYREAEQDGRILPSPCSEEDYNGLKVKYRVYKARDNTPVADCFVLRPDKDMAARAALLCYADCTANSQLAADIKTWWENIHDRKATREEAEAALQREQP